MEYRDRCAADLQPDGAHRSPLLRLRAASVWTQCVPASDFCLAHRMEVGTFETHRKSVGKGNWCGCTMAGRGKRVRARTKLAASARIACQRRGGSYRRRFSCLADEPNG